MIKILFEDDYILICEKTPGLLSEASEAPDSLPLILNSQTGCIVYPVHRLDRPAGGAIIYAKSKKAAAAFSSLVSEGKLSKKYLAVLEGIPQNSEGVLKDYLFKDSRKNKSYTVKKMRKGVKEAELFYKITASAENHSLAEITLKTGRTHQIRVQFASRGFPLAGDGKYGSRDNKCETALWSYALSFNHPFTKKEINVISYPDKNVYPWKLFKKENEM